MTPIAQELLGCIDRQKLEPVVARLGKVAARAAIDRWAERGLLRRPLSRLATRHTDQLAEYLADEMLDDLLGPDDA